MLKSFDNSIFNDLKDSLAGFPLNPGCMRSFKSTKLQVLLIKSSFGSKVFDFLGLKLLAAKES